MRIHTRTHTHARTHAHAHKRAAGINEIAEPDASAVVYPALFFIARTLCIGIQNGGDGVGGGDGGCAFDSIRGSVRSIDDNDNSNLKIPPIIVVFKMIWKLIWELSVKSASY